MKKIKLFFIICLLFLISGCDATYHIEIVDDRVIENSQYIFTATDSTRSPLSQADDYLYEYFENSDILYSRNYQNLSSGYGITSNNEYSLEEYIDKSKVLRSCYVATNFNQTDEYITLKTTNQFQCFDDFEGLDRVNLTIKTNHKIKEHNADEVNGFEYTWNITKENSENKPIILQMYTDKYVFNYDGKFWGNLLKIITIIAILIVGVITTIVIVRSKMKNANKI